MPPPDGFLILHIVSEHVEELPGTAEDVARHEVGHAVVAVLLGGRFDFATIEPADHGAELRSRARVEGLEVDSNFDRATAFMAGMFAASPADSDIINANGCGHDFAIVTALGSTEWLDSSDPSSPAARAKDLVAQHRVLINELAERLLSSRTLTDADVRDAIETGSP